MSKKHWSAISLVLLLIALAGCGAQPNADTSADEAANARVEAAEARVAEAEAAAATAEAKAAEAADAGADQLATAQAVADAAMKEAEAAKAEAEAAEAEAEAAKAEAEAAKTEGAMEEAGPSTEIVVAMGVDATTLDPSLLSDMPSDTYTTTMFDQLVRRDPETMEPIPQLAESWELVDDTTWRLHLRKGVTFHNGEPFNAESVKFTLDRVRDPEVASRGFWAVASVKDVVIVDDYTVDIMTDGPDPILPKRLSFMSTKMLPPKYFEEMGPEEFARHPIGTGPWKFVEWVPDDHVTVEANPDYWQGPPSIGGITFRVVPEASGRLAMLMTGEADVVDRLSPDQVPAVESNPNVRLEAPVSMLVIYAGLNSLAEDGPLTDVRVRQAINYAVDKEAIVNEVLQGFGETNVNAIGPAFECFDPDLAHPYSYDPDRARQLLTEAGYPDGFQLKLFGPLARYTADREFAQAIAGYLEEVGISVELDLMEFGTYASMDFREDTKNGMHILGWGGSGLFVPDLVYMPLFGSDSVWSTYSNPDLDTLMKEAASELDPDRRCELWSQAQNIAVEDAARLFLWEQYDLYGAQNRVEWKATSDNVMNFYDASIK